ncbi:16S rRNA processing protein RimM [bacterium]|nr:16S rRNA processing protein RimM [bacterium]
MTELAGNAPEKAPALVAIGKLGSTHGLEGDLKLYSLSDVSERFSRLDQVWWIGVTGEPKRLKVISVRPGARFFLIHFKDFNNPEDARSLTGGAIAVPPAERGKLPTGHYFVDDIVGLTVEDDKGEIIGRVSGILKTGANDIYEIQGHAGEILLPALKDVILSMDLKAGRMRVRVPEGL